MLAYEEPVVATFYFNDKQWKTALPGRIESTGEITPSAHCVVLTGYDLEAKVILFRNSWGSGWGANGNGEMTFDFFEKYLQDAYLLTPPCDPNASQQDTNCGREKRQ